MSKNKGKFNMRNNYRFIDNAILNDETFFDYLERFEKVALSIFEWVNLPKSMNAMWIEKCLYYFGQATLLKDKNYGFINTKCCTNGKLNLYGLPISLHCYSFEYNTTRKLYTGIDSQDLSEEERKKREFNECILILNNWKKTPTCGSMELFALRLYEAERSADVNIKAQKTPILLLVDDKQKFTMENLYSQYEGNKPFIFGDKNNLSEGQIKSISTEAPFIADKLIDYKKEIWNEALTFLGVNNIMVDKKERLITDEANSNNELINLNLMSYLAPRQEACRQFNEKFGLKIEEIDKEEFDLNDNNPFYFEENGKYYHDKRINVRVRSDLHNIIKNAQSIVNDYKQVQEVDDIIEEKVGDE